MNPKLTLAIVLLVFALADAEDTDINVTSTTRLKPSDEPLTTASEEVPTAHPALNEVCNSSIINNTECYPFVITVKIDDKSNVGPDARVYIIMYGLDKKTNVEANSGKFWLEGVVKDEKNYTDVFYVKVDKMISPISKIEIGIVNSVVGPVLFLEFVTVYSPTTKIEQYFPHHQWLGVNESNEVIQKTLFEQIALRKVRQTGNIWLVTVLTSDRRGAGTDANVFIRLFGNRGESDNIRLNKGGNIFERNSRDEFTFATADLGRIYKIRIWHDDYGPGSGWHLNRVELLNLRTSEHYTFNFDRWLATDEGDRQISVEKYV